MPHSDVVIIGAGLAGLACALELQRNGLSVLVLEASDEVGGRVRTDKVDGFLLDRGFQVLLTAYPEAQRFLDYNALKLHHFAPGSLIYLSGRFYRVIDPWRRPFAALSSLFSPIGTLTDKTKVGRLRRRCITGSVSDLFARPETTTMECLREMGFSEVMIDRFFRPFIGGIFFDHKLDISSRMFQFVFRMFSLGDTSLPEGGMGAISRQLGSNLAEGAVRTHSRVAAIEQTGAILASGEKITGSAVVVATDGAEAARLLGDQKDHPSRGTTCLYFAADEPPFAEPMLVLDGEGKGPVNDLCVPSNVAPSYAPPGKSLIAATIIGVPEKSDGELLSAVQEQLQGWFGSAVGSWHHLRTYWIPHALPLQVPPASYPETQTGKISPWLFVCGEYGNLASIQWALVSGRRAAETVRATLQE